MIEPLTPFHEFERDGWGSRTVVAAYHDGFGGLTSQSIEPLLDAAGVVESARVLDVACGPGYVAAAAFRRGARAIGIDFSEAQLSLARRVHPGIEFRAGDAMALPFPDESVDAVVSGFGMPHFPDPDRFLREAFRVLSNGGRVAFATWAMPSEAVGFGIVLAAIREHGDPDAPLPPGPNFFGFSEPDRCERALRAAGFDEPTFVTVPQTWRLSSPDDVLESLSRGTVRTAALIDAQPPEASAAIRAAVREAGARYRRDDGGIAIPMAAVVAAARKP